MSNANNVDSWVGICVNCYRELVWVIDADPNGEMSCKCRQCEAEEGHDFDLEPDVEFDRYGNRVTKADGGK